MRKSLAPLATIFVLSATLPLGLSAQAAADNALAPDTSWVRRAVIYEVFVKDFSPTGDFQGLIRGLGGIQALGANTLWLMPIHPVGIVGHKGTYGSPYASRDFHAIDSAYGTPDDFRALVRAVHDRGMKLIIDWVPDHTSPDNVWVREHPDFYIKNERGEPSVPRDPDGHLTDWTDVVQLDYHNPAMRREMIATMSWWLTAYGIDGFRVDAAGFVPDQFWQEAVPALRASVQRPILLLAEWGDLKMHRFGFDLTYSWEAYGKLKDVWGGRPASGWTAAAVADAQAMPNDGMRMRFTTNHDETGWDNPPVIRFTNPAGARAAFIAMALLPGRPLIYDGQEVESPQKLRLFEHDPIDWNQPHATEARAFYHRVIQMVQTDSAFRSRDFQALATTDTADVIAYRRGNAVVLVNTRNSGAQFTVSGADVNGTRDLLTGTTQRGATVTLPAFGALVLERRAPGASSRGAH
ncbi:MAG TPA: alpha-amylase family glycosyl hydrolase [Gemmatimonadales bacterium]